MKKLVLPGLLSAVLLVCALAPAVAAADAPPTLSVGNGVWEWFNPRPVGNELWAVAFIGDNAGWVAGSSGTLLRTSDSGTSWQSVGPRTSRWIMGLSFLDTGEGWIVGQHGAIYHTTDGGDSWVDQSCGVDTMLRDAHFLNATDGWVCGENSTVLRTTDGGTTWTDVTQSLVGDVVSVYAASKDEAWVAGEVGIQHTTNGGATWVAGTLPGTVSLTMNDVWFTSTSNGWAVTADDSWSGGADILETTNGGASWELNSTPTGYGLSSITFRTPAIGWTCGESGSMLCTTNGGATWDGQSTFWGDRLWAVTASTGTVWAVGRDGGIVKSTDSGETWDVRTTGPRDYYYDIDMLDDGLTGWAGGMSGAVIRTIDGGLTWSEKPVPPDTINGVSALSPSEMWGVGDYSVIVHTTDSGATWDKLAWAGGTGQLEDVDFVDPAHGWAVGVGSRLLAYNGTWAAQDLGTPYVWLTGVDFADVSNGWVVGGGSAIFHTTDGGAAWQPQTSATGYDLNDVTAIDVNKAVAVGDAGAVIYTTDAGASWHKGAYTPGSGANDLKGVAFADALNGWATGSYGLAVRTTDGGLTWTSQATGCSSWLEDVAAAPSPAPRAWTVGRNAAVLSVPAAVDSTPPSVLAPDAPASGTWLNGPSSFDLVTADPDSGVQFAAVSTDGGTYWSQGTTVTIDADPVDHSNDGPNEIRYAATDNAGNCSAVTTLTVNTDTRLPVARATRSASVVRGRYVRLYYRANDTAPNGGTATVTLRVKTLGGKTVKTVVLKDRLVGKELSYHFRCTLPKKTYRYWVSVVDTAGNSDPTPASNRLVVR